MTSPFEKFERKYAEHQKKIKAREERIRKEESELERERAALVTEGQQHFDGQLLALREQAAGFAKDAAKALAALPPAPVEPTVELINSVGFDEYVRRAEAYPAELEAYEKAAIAASHPLAVALRGLVHQAGTIRNQARSLGFACFNGVAFLYESERGAAGVAGTSLSAFGYSHDNPVEACARAAEGGQLTALQAAALAVFLRKQPEQPAVEKPATVWQRMVRLAGEREQAAEFAARGGAPLTQGERDVIKYTERQANAWPVAAQRDLSAPIGPVDQALGSRTNLEQDRKAREAEEQRRAERRAEEEHMLETVGFARTGGE